MQSDKLKEFAQETLLLFHSLLDSPNLKIQEMPCNYNDISFKLKVSTGRTSGSLPVVWHSSSNRQSGLRIRNANFSHKLSFQTEEKMILFKQTDRQQTVWLEYRTRAFEMIGF